MPTALYLGISEDRFWSMNPRKIHPYSQAKIMWRKEIDEISYYMGLYNYKAFGVTLSQAFSKNGSNTEEYYEKPILTLIQEEEEREEKEKLRQVEMVFAMLEGTYKPEKQVVM